VSEDGGCDEDIDVEARRIPRNKSGRRSAVGRLTGAGLGVHFTYIESTGNKMGFKSGWVMEIKQDDQRTRRWPAYVEIMIWYGMHLVVKNNPHCGYIAFD
jgi:hypothetical protein